MDESQSSEYCPNLISFYSDKLVLRVVQSNPEKSGLTIY